MKITTKKIILSQRPNENEKLHSCAPTLYLKMEGEKQGQINIWRGKKQGQITYGGGKNRARFDKRNVTICISSLKSFVRLSVLPSICPFVC